MKILHIAQNSKNGYEEVTLIANRINRNNHLAAIQEGDGSICWTGGFLLNDTPSIRAVLDAIPKDKQYDFIKEFKETPFVKFYAEEG